MVMKRFTKFMLGIVVVAISLIGCDNVFNEPQLEKVEPTLNLTVVTDNMSRTEYDAELDGVKWSDGDKASIFVNGAQRTLNASIDENDPRIASFIYDDSALTEGVAIVQGFIPSSSLDVQVENGVATRYAINLPAYQYATTTTFDKSADILVADNLPVVISSEDIVAGQKRVSNFNFNRMVAISEVTYKVTNSALLTSDERVESVSFEVVSAGKALAGNMYVQPSDNGAKYVDANGLELSGADDCFYADDANKVTVKLTDKPALKDGFTAWFVTAPITLSADDKLVFTVTTENGTTITKSIDAVGAESKFVTTNKNTLTVTLNDAVSVGKSIKILAIGNSFSRDAMNHLHGILADVGYTDIALGILYKGSCTLEQHAKFFANNSTDYTYYKNTTGAWSNTASYAPYTALVDEDWDYITMQQASGVSGVLSSYDPHLENLIGYVTEECPNAKLIWHMTWAYQGDSTHSAFPTYNSDQMTMYNAIISAVQNRIVDDSNIVGIIPSGTAVQNMRTSYIGDTLTSDGYHLSVDNGCYLVALTFAKSITHCDLSKVSYTPSAHSYTDKILVAMKEAVENAIAKPFEVTASTYAPDPEYLETFESILSQNGYDINDYEAVELGVMPYSYYNSTGGSGTKSSMVYNHNNVQTDTPNKFAATKIFEKSEIPYGSLLVVKSGYKYRPEGWVALNQRPTVRPENVSDMIVVVNREWWGSYNYRAFNLANLAGTALSEEEMVEVCECFAIFRPKSQMAIALKQHGYDISNFTELDIEWTQFAYYDSTNDAEGYGVSQLKNADYSSATAKKFVATQIFNRNDIPNGSVIVVINDFKYRPEGWVTLDTKNDASVRPAQITATLIEVDDLWWGNWNYRAFNVGNGSSLTDDMANDACASFAIFVPNK